MERGIDYKVGMNNYVENDEMLRERVLQVADYVIENGTSTRKTADYFTKNFFSISNATVHTYLADRLKYIDLWKYQQVKTILDGNHPKGVEDTDVQRRVYQVASLLLQGYTISEIAVRLNSTVDTIYDDITSRLKKIEQDEVLLERIQFILQEHSRNNLCNQGHKK